MISVGQGGGGNASIDPFIELTTDKTWVWQFRPITGLIRQCLEKDDIMSGEMFVIRCPGHW